MRYIFIYFPRQNDLRSFALTMLRNDDIIERVGRYGWDSLYYNNMVVVDTMDMKLLNIQECHGNILAINFNHYKVDIPTFLEYERRYEISNIYRTVPERIIYEFPLESDLVIEKLAIGWRKKNKKGKFDFKELNIIL